MIEEFVAIFRCKRFLQDLVIFVNCGIFTALIQDSLGPIFQEQMGFLPSQYPKIKFLLTVVSLDSRFSRRRFLTVLR